MLEHMRRTEAMYIPLLQKGIAKAQAKPNFLYRMVLKRMQSGGRVPTSKDLTPIEPIDLGEVVRGWHQVRAEVMKSASQAVPGQAILKHPLFGKMGAQELIDLLNAHASYHQRFFPNV